MTPIEGHIEKAYVINFEIENKKIIQRLLQNCKTKYVI